MILNFDTMETMNAVTRLITYFAPEHYDLSLSLNRRDRSFTGTVTIIGEYKGIDETIHLHAKDLVIKSVFVADKEVSGVFNEIGDYVIPTPGLLKGQQTVVVSFSGKITDIMNGIYPCYYELKGEKKELIATQFESHFAREAFPCIDEPEAKATFSVTLTTERGVTVLGNMPVASQREENDQLITSFEKSPRMSSYLVAWVVGDLQKKTGHTKSGVEVNIWATPAQPLESLDFALSVATRTIDFFNEYFGTPYPLPKSDHVALPDFSSGAMENWGLVTYRETTLLADPETTSLSDQRYIATVIAHELSHQWFGNLVTMKWWNDLWLNESFASMMECVAIDAIEPDWDIWLYNATQESPSALRRDALDGVQAIQCDVQHPDEIHALFDPSIVYAKGSRLLQMLEMYIGDDAMRRGLSEYFKKFAYQNTEAHDLWNCLSEASGKDIAAFMDAWIEHPGYPVVTIQKTDETISLHQERFFVGPHDPSTTRWPIPLRASSDSLPELLEESNLIIPVDNPLSPLRLNSGASGHYITNYDSVLLDTLLSNIQDIPTIDRLYLLQEQMLLTHAGTVPSATLIPLLHAFRQETQEPVWDGMSAALIEIRKFVDDNDEAKAKLHQFIASLARNQYNALGWDKKEGEPETDTLLRSTIIPIMLSSEEPDVITEAVRRFSTTPLEELDADLRPTIIATAVKQRLPGIVDSLLAAYQVSNQASLRDDIAAGLTATRDITVIERLAGILQDTTVVRPQDFLHWFAWLLRNRYGREYMWVWIREHWTWVHEQFENDSHFDSFPRHIASGLRTAKHLEEYHEFFLPWQQHHALKRNIIVGETELKGRAELIARDSDAVQEALLDLEIV